MTVGAKRALTLVCWAGVAAMGCADDTPADPQTSAWEALMGDGDASGLSGPASSSTLTPPPPRSCTDCAREPLAFWTMDDCNTNSTLLLDFAGTSPVIHPAFRAVSVPCVAGASLLGIKLAAKDDIMYAPDQPDLIFDQGLTIAGWIKANSLSGTQSLVRKRFDGNSSFTLAIDDRKLTFVVRLTNGKLVGVTASIKADRLTHVAATYDGQRAQLFVDGALAAKANGAGKIAPGAGPILMGNDMDGRQFKGILDEVWLNNLAAPADTVKGLTCIRKAPVATLSPATTAPTPPNTVVAFDLAITNPSGASCPADQFQYFGSVPFPLIADQSFGSIAIGPAQTGHVTIHVAAYDAGVTGPIPFQYTVANSANFNFQAVPTATFVVAPPAP